VRMSRLPERVLGIAACAAWLLLAGASLAGGAPVPDSAQPTAVTTAAAPETPAAPAKAAERTKLLIVPEKVLIDAARDRTFIEGGPQVTSVSGNAHRFRRYFFTEPSRLFVLQRLRTMGTDGDRQVMYDIGVTTPGLESSKADLLVRGFDAAPTLRAEWDRSRFYRDFGPGAGLSTRENLEVSGRVRLAGKAWVDVAYRTRGFDSPSGSIRPIAYRTDELAATTSWVSGETTFQAALSVSRYVDQTQGITRTGNWLRANRVTTRASVSAASADESDLQWRLGASWRSSGYASLGGQRYTSFASGAGIQYRAGGHLLLTAGLGYVVVPRTVTTNTYNPMSATVRLAGTYTGMKHLRTTFGYERRFGKRYAVRPDLTTPQGFTESQTVDRLWLTGRMKNRSGFTVEYGLRYRHVDGSVTSYLGSQTTAVPILLYPEQTAFEVSSSYPTDMGFLSGSLTVGRFRNPSRGTVVGSVGFTGLWTRTWSGKWTGLLQYDHVRYVSTGRSSTSVDCDLGGWTAAVTYSHRKASLTGSCSYYQTIGTFRARTADARLNWAYRASHDLTMNLVLCRQLESGIGPLAYNGSTVLLTGAYEF
jgi:hypothetical protein